MGLFRKLFLKKNPPVPAAIIPPSAESAPSPETIKKPLPHFDTDQKRLFKAIHCRNGDSLKIISEVIMTWPDLLEKKYKDEDGLEKNHDYSTPLTAAIEENRADVFKHLVSLGAKLDTDSYVRTPLSAAAEFNNTEAARYLIQRGVPLSRTTHHYVNNRYKGMSSAHEIAQSRGHNEIASMIDGATDIIAEYKRAQSQRPKNVSEDAYMNALAEIRKNFFAAIKNGNLSGISYAVEGYKYALLWRDSNGMKPLHVAYVNGRVDSFHRLITLGADINESPGKNALPRLIHMAVRDNDALFLNYLLADSKTKLDMPGMTITLEDYADSLGHKEAADLIRVKKMERGEIKPGAEKILEDLLQMPNVKPKPEQRIDYLEEKLKEAFNKIAEMDRKLRAYEEPPALTIKKTSRNDNPAI